MTALDRGLALHLTLTQDDRRTVVDSSGNGNNGTARGRAQPVDDPTLGRCYQFNGTTDYVEIPPLGRTDTVTIQLWVRADVLDRTRTVLACADWPTGNLLIEFVNTRLKVNLTGGEPGTRSSGTRSRRTAGTTWRSATAAGTSGSPCTSTASSPRPGSTGKRPR